VTIADFGKGKVIYVGTLLEPRFYVDLARQACEWANLESGPEMPDGVDAATRQKGLTSFLFLLNFNDSEKTIKLAGKHRDLLSGTTFEGSVTVPPLDLSILVKS
jgi:beta-galactosidase